MVISIVQVTRSGDLILFGMGGVLGQTVKYDCVSLQLYSIHFALFSFKKGVEVICQNSVTMSIHYLVMCDKGYYVDFDFDFDIDTMLLSIPL